jgi:polyhydroxyalkanoate synthase subunit PhaC
MESSQVKSDGQHNLVGSAAHPSTLVANPSHSVASRVADENDPINYAAFETFDRALRAWHARITQGISPVAIADAWLDWAVHLLAAPGKQAELAMRATTFLARFGHWLPGAALGKPGDLPAAPSSGERSYSAPAWSAFPFNALVQAHLLAEAWWLEAARKVPGVERRHEAEVRFMIRQFVDVFAPANIPWMNPEILGRTAEESGRNLHRGMKNWVEDVDRYLAGKGPVGIEMFRVGRELATTPGKVVYRNSLVEVIQYEPTTPEVYAEPILIVPAWIMKYYILDLTPESSLVRWLVGNGHTVFIISWKNPDRNDRELSLDDYRQNGVMSALNAVSAIMPERKIHTCGYCLGGTILTIAAAAMARDRDDRIATITLLAAQTDFADPGELTLFLDERQLMLLEDLMWDQGYLDTHQMAAMFQALRSNELVWSRLVRSYVLGDRDEMNALSAWNSDQTRMPARMHTEYLRGLFLENRLSAGRFAVDGRVIAMRDIRAPIFSVGTSGDHIAPWRSVYKVNLFVDTDVTFALVSGGHNVGVVNPPFKAKGEYQLMARRRGQRYLDPDTWATQAPKHEGSWWPAWEAWLVDAGAKARVPPPSVGNCEEGYVVLGDAPGEFVQRR